MFWVFGFCSVYIHPMYTGVNIQYVKGGIPSREHYATSVFGTELPSTLSKKYIYKEIHENVNDRLGGEFRF